MKTKEEIEQLAEEFLTFHQDGSKVYHIKIREAIEFAYTQCQEDMVDRKYTEEDMFKVWLRCRFHSDEQQLSYELELFKNFINSLNKKD